MTGDLPRAVAFVVVGLLALVAPALDRTAPVLAVVASVVPFVAVAAVALGTTEGRVFDLLARPTDYEAGRLYGIAGFALAAAGLAIVTRFGLPHQAFVASVLLLSVGDLSRVAVREHRDDPFLRAVGFVLGAVLAAVGAFALVGVVTGSWAAPALVAFVAASGALAAGILRAVFFEDDLPLVMIAVALLLWLLLGLDVTVDPTRVAVGLGLTVVLGGVAYGLETASIPGMLTGVLLSLLAVVLGGYGWFAVLVTFFALGGLAAKYRYDDKRERGIAEPNRGARGSGNVLANSAVALVAVLAFASSEQVGVAPTLFRFAFTGSVAAAMSDTLSSEIGGLYDHPRLITTLERVPAGTDGAVTVPGELAGLVGAGLIAGIAGVFFEWGPIGLGIVVAAGVAGMTVDSLLGATLEGWWLNNQGVNLLATLAAAAVAAALAASLGVI